MSYLVLARKYRPQRFADLVGQPHVNRTLINGLVQKRLAHAYLMSGPRGVGKTTTARLLARAINCLTPDQGEPCGICGRCRATLEGRAIDVVEIDAASNNGVDDIRELRGTINFAPIEGGAKVYIIDEVHMLSTGAFNALLKTLEEPPDHAYFCLATTSPTKVPSTILSRCQRFDFRRVSANEIATHLANILTKESIPFEQTALEVIARKADGSVRDSLSLLDQVIAFAGGQVMWQDAVDVVGEVRLDLYFKAISLIESHSLADAFDLDRELASRGVDPQDYLGGLQEQVVQLLHVKAAGIDNSEVPKDLRQDYAEMAERVGEGDLVRILQLLTAAETDVRRNFNPRTRIQLLFVKLATFERSIVLADLIATIEKGALAGTSTASAPPPHRPAPASPPNYSPPRQAVSQPPSESRPAPVSPPPPSAGDDQILRIAQSNWSQICDKLAEQHNSRARMLKPVSWPVSCTGGMLRINFAMSAHSDTARSIQGSLKDAIASFTGPVMLDLQIGPVPQQKEEAPSEPDPAMKLLMSELGARLV